MKYTLAILLLASLPSVVQAQSGTRGAAPTIQPIPQATGSRGQDNSSPALSAPANRGALSGESYSTPPSSSGTNGYVEATPYAVQSPECAPEIARHCGRVYSYYVPVQTYYAAPVYYRPYYGRRYFGGRRRYFGY